MIQVQTELQVADNTGAKRVECIKVLGGSKRRYAGVGDLIVVSVKDALPNGKVKKGSVHKAVIVRTKKEIFRKDGSKVHLEINEWNCEFELFILESLRLVEEPSQREVVQVQEWVMASCNPPGSPSYEFKFSTSCQNLDGPLGLWDKKKFQDSTSIILKNPEDFVKVTLSCE